VAVRSAAMGQHTQAELAAKKQRRGLLRRVVLQACRKRGSAAIQTDSSAYMPPRHSSLAR
jgi:hypothetical protein